MATGQAALSSAVYRRGPARVCSRCEASLLASRSAHTGRSLFWAALCTWACQECALVGCFWQLFAHLCTRLAGP